jgi:hypothetical protein
MLTGRLTYYHMNSFYPFPGNQKIFGPGTARGENMQARLDFAPNKNWKAHVLYETQLPGDYYRVQNNGFFLRFEVSYLVTAKLKTNDFKRALGFGGGAPSSETAARQD